MDTTVPAWRIDDIAEKKGHAVLRLSPYHCMMNSVELICSQVKEYMVQNTRTFKLYNVQKLVEDGVTKVAIGK